MKNKASFKIEVGERFKQVREYLKLTQVQLGTVLGCSQEKIKDIETGRTNVVPDTALKLSEVYSISLNWLYLNKGSMFLTEELTPEEREVLRNILIKLSKG